MQRTILFSLFALLAVHVPNGACAQHRGESGSPHARPDHHFDRGFDQGQHGRGYGYWPYGFGYTDLPYDSDDSLEPDYSSDAYSYPPQPGPPQWARFQQPPAQPALKSPVHPVVNEYKWPAATAASSVSDSEPRTFTIVLKNGSTLSALMILSSEEGLRYVDPNDKLQRISMSQIDRAATLKLNRARNLNLDLPAAE